MYVYDNIDHRMLADRIKQFRSQTQRFLAGELSNTEFLPLRLQNGLYVQRLAPMLRIAVPYGMLSSTQVRMLAHISRKYDKGYVHFSTRQNVQLNWPRLEEVPDILADLASVEMHGIQTSGNCIRNTTTDEFAGVAADELLDPRPYCEIIRQWSTFHPEFAFLPRKFKIAVCASDEDRAAIHAHDIGLQILKNAAGEIGFRVLVGGGLGRTPVVGVSINEFLPEKHLLTYLDAILRIYNQLGRRDNKYKARIKILVRALGAAAFKAKVDEEWQFYKDGPATLTPEEIARMKQFFTEPTYEKLDDQTLSAQVAALASDNKAFSNWLGRNVKTHQKPGYAIVNLTLKKVGIPPGDVTDKQLETIADMADRYSFGEIRTTHQQNLVLADVKKSDLFEVWQQLKALGLATPNLGTLTDIICCPGGDYCSLANAKSIPVAEAIQRRFDDIDYLYDLGDIDLNISGCMNACGHHHVGHIGILGVDKKGEEFYQIMLGGNGGLDASLAEIIGPSFSTDAVPAVISDILDTYVQLRSDEETFLDTFRRVGVAPFKERVYAQAH
jgi:sulfite reductase (NADPH) hemoprotein beta-component